jgi:hypothetical protein
VNEPYDYSTTEVAAGPAPVPDAFVLAQNYPNPFNASTIFQFTIPRAGRVKLDVHNALGETVGVVAEGSFMAGTHMATWTRNDLPSGFYIYRLWFEGQTSARKLIIIK